MQRTDRWGLETTAPTDDALARLEQLIDDFVTFDALLPEHLGAAVTEPAAPMARVVMGPVPRPGQHRRRSRSGRRPRPAGGRRRAQRTRVIASRCARGLDRR
ncbi:MAG: hypothetical protein R2710_13200 [Acidimicrobiales bacterium]